MAGVAAPLVGRRQVRVLVPAVGPSLVCNRLHDYAWSGGSPVPLRSMASRTFSMTLAELVLAAHHPIEQVLRHLLLLLGCSPRRWRRRCSSRWTCTRSAGAGRRSPARWAS